MVEMANEAKGELPLVTFALFAYNQEKYIREAVEGALAQDYPNLEIIISDDCSQDETVAQAELAIAGYKGPHRVEVRTTKTNLGPFRHVLDVAKFARGQLLVLAAGDDISKPARVSRLATAWLTEGAWGLSSRYDTIDADGNGIESNLRTEELFSPDFNLRHYFKDRDDIGIVHGATSAYSMELFRSVHATDVPWILSEDGTFSLLINLMNKKIMHLDESLINYRAHDDALTNFSTVAPGKDALYSFIKKAALYALSSRNRAEYFLAFAMANNSVVGREINQEFVRRDILRQDLRAKWAQMSFAQRFVRSLALPGDWKWTVPRIFGVSAYVTMKLLRDRLHSL